MANPYPTTPGEIAERIVDLEAKLKARKRLPSANWGENCRAIETEITRLKSIQNASEAGS